MPLFTRMCLWLFFWTLVIQKVWTAYYSTSPCSKVVHQEVEHSLLKCFTLLDRYNVLLKKSFGKDFLLLGIASNLILTEN